MRRVINARGTFTPLGVSRSPESVMRATADALGRYIDMEELAECAGAEIAHRTGAEWGCVTHCTAASITLACAALMTGRDEANIGRLPDSTGMRSGIVIQSGHLVNYGQPIEQAVRLTGAEPVIAGSRDHCTREQLSAAVADNHVAGLLLVASRLCRGTSVPLRTAVETAHEAGVPVVLDAAAQDLQMSAMLATGADLVLFSGQKYLASPTAGLVLGRRDLVDAVHAQQRGIGRGMKAGKEAILGVIEALRVRGARDVSSWMREQKEKAADFISALNRVPGISAESVPDPVGNPFSRVRAWIDHPSWGARLLAESLWNGETRIAVQDHDASDRALVFEIVDLAPAELFEIVEQLYRLMAEVDPVV